MKKIIQFLAILSIIHAFVPSVILAWDDPNFKIFEANTKAYARDVNTNFEIVEAAVNSKQDQIVGECSEGELVQGIDPNSNLICQEDNVGVTSIEEVVVGSGLKSTTVDRSVYLEIDTNGIETSHIENGTITNEDISISANIDVAKILGNVGFNYNKPDGQPLFPTGCLPQNFTISDPNMITLKSLEINAPAEGYILLYHSGYIEFGENKNIIEVGIGGSPTRFLDGCNYLEMGKQTGVGTDSYVIPYNVMAVAKVEAGKKEFFALARRKLDYTETATVFPKNLIAIFIPSSKLYNI